MCLNILQHKPFTQKHNQSNPPLPLCVLPTALHGVTVTGDVIKGLPQELLRLWGGPCVIDGYHVSPCQPLFIALRLEFLHKYVHGNLHHVFTA